MTDSLQKLSDLHQALHTTCKQLGRSANGITLIAVSKTFPADKVREFYHAGQRDFGENYIREWEEKAAGLPEDIVWHIIGDVQSNKTRAVAARAAWVHTVSRIKTAQRLSAQRPANLPDLNICLEVNISGEAQKHGANPAQIPALAQTVVELPHLVLRGLMCIPAQGSAETVRRQMSAAQTLFLQLKSRFPQVDTLSMGMSGDWRLALEYGATHLRIGSALFGSRSYKEKNAD